MLLLESSPILLRPGSPEFSLRPHTWSRRARPGLRSACACVPYSLSAREIALEVEIPFLVRFDGYETSSERSEVNSKQFHYE